MSIVLKSGDASGRTTTDQKGQYEIAGLPAGSYEISAAMPSVPADRSLRRFDLVAGACSSQNFVAVQVGSIGGRLVDSEGTPISGVLVEIEAVPPTSQPQPLFRHFTDKEGRFTHTLLEAGEYLLEFNLKSPPNARDWYGVRIPYAGSYYPGIANRSDAQVIHLEGGQKLENLEFRVPKRRPYVVFAGEVVSPAGSPAESNVWLMDLDFLPDSGQVDSVRTEADGRFTLTGAEGQRYAVFAHNAGRVQHVHSEVLETPQLNGKPLRLVLSNKVTADDCEICKRFKHLWRSPNWRDE